MMFFKKWVWKLFRKSYPNSRLWKNEEISDFIIKNRNIEAVEAIVLSYIAEDLLFSLRVLENMCFSADVFQNMKNIRLLHICGDFTSCEPTTFPDELRWLRWDGYPFSSLPVDNLRKLVGLEMQKGEVECLWKGYKVMPYLKFIHLEKLFRLKKFPDISGAPNVERLILSDCINLEEVHKSIGALRKIAYMKISNCWKLNYLPSMIDMKSLETLDLFDCRGLEKFPEVSSSMGKLSNIYLVGCSNLSIIPSSICKLKSLKSLHLHDCMQLLPKELGNMEKLEVLELGFTNPIMAFQRRRPDSINFHTLTNLCCLRKLDLSWRPIEDAEFFNNLDAFSSLEELHLSGNSKLVHLPASISRLSRLKHLELNHCQQLQNIQGLPSGIQVLKARDCRALEKIDDLTEEYVWLHKIFFMGCGTLVENQENVRYLDKMLQQSLLKKCVAGDRQLSIWIPGSKIPSWFKEQYCGHEIATPRWFKEQNLGHEIALKLPPNRHRSIMGFAICIVFRGNWWTTYGNNSIIHTTEDNGTVSMFYIPVSVFWRQMYDAFGAFDQQDDWSLFGEGGCSISIMTRLDVIRCGAHIVYKEDLESIQQNRPPISNYGDSEDVCQCGTRFMYRIKFGARSIGNILGG